MDFEFDLPKGVYLRYFSQSVSVRVEFQFRGNRCRETYCRIVLPDETVNSQREFEAAVKRSVKTATRLLARIHHDIDTHSFNYSSYFPDSRLCHKYGHIENTERTVGFYLEQHLERAKTRVRPKSYEIACRTVANQLMPDFGNILVSELTAGMLRDWVFARSKTIKRKTIANFMSPLKLALDDAVMDGLIAVNPARLINLDKIITKEARKSDFKVDPFTEEEIRLVLESMEGQVRNLYQFAFYTGLRTSELIGLTWDKVDFDKREVLIDQAMVYGHLNKLKTADKGVSSRCVVLLDEAMEALEAQKSYTFKKGKFVFHNPRTNTYWDHDVQLRKRAWEPAIRKSGVRYRNPYQTRHTYAHMMIRDNENLWWIANQMGHSGIDMLNRHYGG